MILEGEIKDAKLRSFSSNFQTLVERYFPLYFLYELLMSLRSIEIKYTKLNQNAKWWFVFDYSVGGVPVN